MWRHHHDILKQWHHNDNHISERKWHDHDSHKKTSLSALRFGADFQLSLSLPAWTYRTLIPTDNYFYATPYYQTDYRGLAQIEGVNFSYQPVIPLLLINKGTINANFGYMTQLSIEGELTQVNNTGLTLLTHGHHDWIGETARPNLQLFPIDLSADSPPSLYNSWIAGRISLIGTQQFYWDANTGKTNAYYSAQLAIQAGRMRSNQGCA